MLSQFHKNTKVFTFLKCANIFWTYSLNYQILCLLFSFYFLSSNPILALLFLLSIIKSHPCSSLFYSLLSNPILALLFLLPIIKSYPCSTIFTLYHFVLVRLENAWIKFYLLTGLLITPPPVTSVTIYPTKWCRSSLAVEVLQSSCTGPEEYIVKKLVFKSVLFMLFCASNGEGWISNQDTLSMMAVNRY